MLDKINLRIIMKNKRLEITQDQKEKLDEEIFKNVIHSEYYKKAKNIFIYVSFKAEADTLKIIRYALKQGKKVCVPKVISLKKGMQAVYINSIEELKPSSLGILEPESTNPVADPDSIDVIFIPGLAFDLKGGRIGYGGGFYDRFLSDQYKVVPQVALAYEMQILNSVPMEELDIPVDGIITEANTYTIDK